MLLLLLFLLLLKLIQAQQQQNDCFQTIASIQSVMQIELSRIGDSGRFFHVHYMSKYLFGCIRHAVAANIGQIDLYVWE